MAGRNFLFVPGPTNTPDRVLRAMHRAMEDHRSSDFPSLAQPIFEDLKKIFKTTSGQPFIFPASGTGAWEASLANTLSPGDRVLAARFGMFSHLWIDMAQRLGLRVDVLDAEWGEGAPIERYQEALAADQNHRIKAVLFTQNETATGVTSDVAAMRRALNDTKHPALLMVDGVSSIASLDFRMDEWGVDLAVTGSQKGLMLPAGLGIVCASQKALAQYDQAKLPRVFFDFGDMRKANATGYFPYTPSLPMLYGLQESLAMLLEDLGLAKRGEAAARVRAGHFSRGGEMPLNTHGGLLSYGHCGVGGAMAHLVETHLQMTERAGTRQVRDASIALLHGDGGVLSSHVSMFLERVR